MSLQKIFMKDRSPVLEVRTFSAPAFVQRLCSVAEVITAQLLKSIPRKSGTDWNKSSWISTIYRLRIWQPSLKPHVEWRAKTFQHSKGSKYTSVCQKLPRYFSRHQIVQVLPVSVDRFLQHLFVEGWPCLAEVPAFPPALERQRARPYMDQQNWSPKMMQRSCDNRPCELRKMKVACEWPRHCWDSSRIGNKWTKMPKIDLSENDWRKKKLQLTKTIRWIGFHLSAVWICACLGWLATI